MSGFHGDAVVRLLGFDTCRLRGTRMRTSLYSILCIVIRLGAVFLAANTVVALPLTWQAVTVLEHGSGFTSVFFGFAGAILGLAALLWIYPGVLARVAAGTSSRQIFESPISAEEIQRVALAVVGVSVAMHGILDLSGDGLLLLASRWMSNTVPGDFTPQDLARIITAIAKIGLGVGLAFGSHGLVGMLRRFRERGAPPQIGDE